MKFEFNAIGVIRSPYKEKFAVPRQPDLVTLGKGELHLLPPYHHPDAVRGLAQFSHIWLMFVFHHLPEKTWKPTVRPPRLGGNTRMGVFATRSPFRPNPIGLSLVELNEVVITPSATILKLGGLDLVDGTPIIDIKPYLPFVESRPNARAGFAQQAPEALLNVQFTHTALDVLAQHKTQYPELESLIIQVLQQDPRPAYKKNKETKKIYAIHLYEFNIKWAIEDHFITVWAIDYLPESVEKTEIK